MTNTESKQQRADRLINQEVRACVSSLISTLAQGYGAIGFDKDAKDLSGLMEQAFELASPISDYEEAAFEAGWTRTPEGWFWREPIDDEAENGHADFYFLGSGPFVKSEAGTWEALCNAEGIEPHALEVYEHWIVSPWLADKLEAKGEKVDRDFASLTVWARTTTGQAISIDGVIESIVDDLYAPDPAELLAAKGFEVRHDVHGFYVCTDTEAEHEDEGNASVGFDGRAHWATIEDAYAAFTDGYRLNT